jgi:hypothetical protein
MRLSRSATVIPVAVAIFFASLSITPAASAAPPAPRSPRLTYGDWSAERKPNQTADGSLAPAINHRTLVSKTVPLSSLPAATQRTIRAADATAPPNVKLYAIVNEQDGKCLDADSRNITVYGDKVQVYQCFYDPDQHPNQWWWLSNPPADGSFGETLIVNAASNLCLDADNSRGLGNGSKVQLWGCFWDRQHHANQWWSFGPDGDFTPLTNLGDGKDDLVLDAAEPWINYDGDYVQLWQFTGASNQEWLQ